MCHHSLLRCESDASPMSSRLFSADRERDDVSAVIQAPLCHVVARWSWTSGRTWPSIMHWLACRNFFCRQHTYLHSSSIMIRNGKYCKADFFEQRALQVIWWYTAVVVHWTAVTARWQRHKDGSSLPKATSLTQLTLTLTPANQHLADKFLHPSCKQNIIEIEPLKPMSRKIKKYRFNAYAELTRSST